MRELLVILALAAGVLAPKIIPGLVIPRRLPASVSEWLDLAGPALIAGLAALAAANSINTAKDVVPFAVAALATLRRRPFVAMLVGWAALIAVHLGG